MEINPYLQFTLFCAAFGAGLLQGLFFELLTVLRILLGAYPASPELQALYERPLPLLKRSVGYREGLRPHRVWRGVVVGIGDFFFCLGFALLITLVLYCYNNGKIRLLALLLALAGFALFRFVAARLLGTAVAYFAFGVAALRLYLLAALCLPFRLLWQLCKRLIFKPVQALFKMIYLRRAEAATKRLCSAQLDWARSEFSLKEG